MQSVNSHLQRILLRQFKEISITRPLQKGQNMQNHLRRYNNHDVHQKQSRPRASRTIINESRFFRPFCKNRFYRDVNPRVTNADKLIVYRERKYSNIERQSDANCCIVRAQKFPRRDQNGRAFRLKRTR